MFVFQTILHPELMGTVTAGGYFDDHQSFCMIFTQSEQAFQLTEPCSCTQKHLVGTCGELRCCRISLARTLAFHPGSARKQVRFCGVWPSDKEQVGGWKIRSCPRRLRREVCSFHCNCEHRRHQPRHWRRDRAGARWQ